VAELERLQKLIVHAFTASRWHVDDLTDAEFFHEPTQPCWGVWRTHEARRDAVVGRGHWVMDVNGDDEPLVATIGWRVLHLAVWTDIYREWTFGVRRPRAEDFDYPGDASAAVDWLERAQRDFFKHVRALTEAQVADTRPTHDGGKRGVGDLVWDVAVEHEHHGAEIGLLRDLVRGKARDGYPGSWQQGTH
jgi:hypothetical protein